MDSQYERELEAEIDRELKALPELRAPATLVPRVLATLAARSAVSKRRQLWQSWPLGLRVASLVALLGLFAGLCLASSVLGQAAPVATWAGECQSWFSGLGALCRGVMALPGLLTTVLEHLNPWVLLSASAALLLTYLACVALAACSLRLGLIHTRN